MSIENYGREPLKERLRYKEIPAIKQYLENIRYNWDLHHFLSYPLIFTVTVDNRPDLIKILLKAGANPNIIVRDTYMTTLQLATQNNSMKIVKILLKYGVDPNFNYEHGPTLCYSIWHDNIKIVKLLLKYGADPYLKNSQGYSTLYYAVVNKKTEIVELFLSFKQKPYFRFLQQYFCSDIAKYISKYC